MNITSFLRLLLVFCFLLGVQKGRAQCSPNFTWSAGANGQVAFTAVPSLTNANTAYTWIFGNGSFSAGIVSTSAMTTYTSNGSYVVTLIMTMSAPVCSASITQTVTVNNAPSPTCSMQVNYTPPSPPNACNGTATVVSISGMCGPPSYSWSNGASTATVGNLCIGAYTVTALSANGSNCCSTILSSVNISSCSVNASFLYTLGANGLVSFASTSTGTLAGSTYSWLYGDGNGGSGTSSQHTYSASGTYSVTLFVNNNPGNCADSVTVAITIPPCNLTAGFNFLPAPGGTATFSSTSGGASPTYH